jgi:hypothetical protein
MYGVVSGAPRKLISAAIIRNWNKRVSRTDGRLVYNRRNSSQNFRSSANFAKAKRRRRYDKNPVLINGHMAENI